MRLNKFIAQSGHCSRRKADRLIEDGHVRVNGTVVTSMGVQIDPQNDRIEVEGKTLESPSEFVTLLLHKPAGYTTTKSDPHAEKTIYELLPETHHHLHPAGRLDRETEGLLILTNDGDLTYRLTHPKHGSEKQYEVHTHSPLTPEQIDQIENGLDIEEEGENGETTLYRTQPCTLVPMERPTNRSTHRQAPHSDPPPARYRITLKEGRKRQIRKMFGAVDRPVIYLKRLTMGPFALNDLPCGEWKLVEPKTPPTP